ncbi:MAG: hypothetical protein WCO26_11530, partial [Deltaproteobacteria bacterium]
VVVHGFGYCLLKEGGEEMGRSDACSGNDGLVGGYFGAIRVGFTGAPDLAWAEGVIYKLPRDSRERQTRTSPPSSRPAVALRRILAF